MNIAECCRRLPRREILNGARANAFKHASRKVLQLLRFYLKKLVATLIY
jgi:hypothetical protein